MSNRLDANHLECVKQFRIRYGNLSSHIPSTSKILPACNFYATFLHSGLKIKNHKLIYICGHFGEKF